MNAKKVLTIILIALLVTTALLPACSDKTEEIGELFARLDGGNVLWDAFPGASYYTVTCTMEDGKKGYSIRIDELTYTPPYSDLGDHVYVIAALDGSGKVIARSSPLVYHLGIGSYADPIEISSAEELLAIEGSKSVSFGKATVNAPLAYRLTKDVDLTGVDFSPIGNTTAPFRGYFDGNGHKITGLTMTKCNADGAYGLFGATENATIKNLILEDASMTYDKNSGVTGSQIRLGLLIGSASYTQVDNCHVTGSMDILTKVTTMDSNRLSAGGLVGLATSGAITCCSFAGAIKAQYGWVYAGGILGECKSTSPKFAMLNCAANAVVEGKGTAYNVTSGVSDTYVRVGVIGGSITSAEQLSALLAVGTATASARDGTAADRATSGVFGKTSMSGSTNSVPLRHLYYSGEKIEKVSGTASSLGTYQKDVHPLSEAELRTAASYLDGESYGLDFNGFWTMKEGELPALSGIGATALPPEVKLTVRSEIDDVNYEINLAETFMPACYALGVSRPTYHIGFQLESIINAMALSHPAGTRLVISADNAETVNYTINTTNTMPYLTYGVHASHEAPADFFTGYKVVDPESASLTTYDFTAAKHISVTILPAENA